MAADCERGNKLSCRPGQAQPPSWFPSLCEVLFLSPFFKLQDSSEVYEGRKSKSSPSGVLSFKFDVTSSRPFGTPSTHPSFIELHTNMEFLLLRIGLVFTNVGLAHTFFHLMLYTHLSLFTYTILLFSSPLEWMPQSPVDPNCENPWKSCTHCHAFLFISVLHETKHSRVWHQTQ